MFRLCSLVSLIAMSALASAAEPKSLFNGKDLTGWEGRADLWKVVDGAIVGESPGLKENHFLVTADEYGDFELTFEVKLHDPKENSGVQFRSQRLPNSTEMIGYQADIGLNCWGSLYDESRRRKFVAAADAEVAAKALKPSEWNDYVVRAQGGRITLSINGTKTVDYEEPDPAIPRTGKIGLQVHSGGPFKIEFRKLMLQAIP
ncbi:MAG: DUF1080 domain-containing protein [Planctomycetaceae bacterium]|nr:DUF1080 domain-containing protein [Planctomycetaceae bacterium]